MYNKHYTDLVLAIIDKRSPKESLKTLNKYVDNIFLFETENITYNSISCHPDIFIYQDNSAFIIAPNSPQNLINYFNTHKIYYKIGLGKVGRKLKNSTLYNCLANDKYFFHKQNFSDKSILDVNKSKSFINLPQAYTACSLIQLDSENYITSDYGIQKQLENRKFNVCYFSPEQIKIIDHKNGFIGGTVGILRNKLFFNGNIDLHKDGKKLRKFVESKGFEIICLHRDFLYDGGKIFFV